MVADYLRDNDNLGKLHAMHADLDVGTARNSFQVMHTDKSSYAMGYRMVNKNSYLYLSSLIRFTCDWESPSR